MRPKKIHKIALVCSLLPYIANSDVVKHSYPFSKHYISILFSSFNPIFSRLTA
nr:hypothetical protein VCHA53O474_200048 [Vibrio chagasii]